MSRSYRRTRRKKVGSEGVEAVGEGFDDAADVVAGESVVRGKRECAVHHAVGARQSVVGCAVRDRSRTRAGAGCCPVHTMRVGMPRSRKNCCIADRSMPSASTNGKRIHVVSTSGVVRGESTLSSWCVEHLVEAGEVLLPRRVEALQPLELHEPVRGHDLRRLEVVAHVVEDEDRVVGRAVVERREPRLRPDLAGCRTGTSPIDGPTAAARVNGRTTRSRRRR